jgi:hypothetical protein
VTGAGSVVGLPMMTAWRRARVADRRGECVVKVVRTFPERVSSRPLPKVGRGVTHSGFFFAERTPFQGRGCAIPWALMKFSAKNWGQGGS